MRIGNLPPGAPLSPPAGPNVTNRTPPPPETAKDTKDGYQPSVSYDLPAPSLKSRLLRRGENIIKVAAAAGAGAAAGFFTGTAAIAGVLGGALGWSMCETGEGKCAMAPLLAMGGAVVGGAFQLGAGAVTTPVALAGAALGGLAGAAIALFNCDSKATHDSVHENLGLELQEAGGQFRVARVDDKSMASVAGLKPGDLISVDQIGNRAFEEPPKTAGAALQRLEDRLADAHDYHYDFRLDFQVTRDGAPVDLRFPKTWQD